MTNQEKQLNEKLNEWAGTKEVDYLSKDSGLSACFRWLVPKLYPYPQNKMHIHFKRDTSYPEHINEINCWFYQGGRMDMYEGWSLDSPALALCLAIEKLIEVME